MFDTQVSFYQGWLSDCWFVELRINNARKFVLKFDVRSEAKECYEHLCSEYAK